MFFRILISVLLVFIFSDTKAQVNNSRQKKSQPADKISILTKNYLGFDVYEMPVVERILQLLKDSLARRIFPVLIP